MAPGVNSPGTRFIITSSQNDINIINCSCAYSGLSGVITGDRIVACFRVKPEAVLSFLTDIYFCLKSAIVRAKDRFYFFKLQRIGPGFHRVPGMQERCIFVCPEACSNHSNNRNTQPCMCQRQSPAFSAHAFYALPQTGF